ncbi:hypothetical protein D5F01_LYC22874 [Larimichthys crocea]|uniref:Ig-like domain-containing protein n=1 Tax=Larimichthys crocea TaxID=215358 RepID=A0A6G0HJ69_LARCR|nr:hypothetical protein D5F01_LYC22874 [Larimichthys crocea]
MKTKSNISSEAEEQSDVSVLDVKMGHTLLRVLELFLLNTLLYVHAEVSNKVSLTLQPNWTQIFKWISSATESDSGDYWCMGRRDSYSSTEWSDPIKLTVSARKPKPRLTTDNIPVRGTVRLTCSVEDSAGWKYDWFKRTSDSSEAQSIRNGVPHKVIEVSEGGLYHCRGGRGDPPFYTEESNEVTVHETVSNKVSLTLQPNWPQIFRGWRFYWYKTVPKLPDYSYSLELLPVSSNGTEQDSYIVHGQTGTARYVCRAERGDPVYYTQYSEPKFVWSRDFHSSASLTVSPDRVQHFTSDSVSLNCEGNSTEWRVRGLTGNRYLSYCSYWGTMTGSTCNMYSSWQSDGVFWCESGSGEFSNAVNISLQDINIILVSPVHPVTEGDPVSLSCKLRTGIFDSNVFFYRNDELIQNDTRKERNISAVSKSDEGFYKCQYSGEESSQSWMSVKDSCFISQSERTNQGSDTNQVLNQNEAQGAVYSTLLHGDPVAYESIKGAEDTENVAGGSQDVTYSLIELKNIKKKGKQHGPEESTVYSDVKTRTADDNLMYAQVNHHNKGKAKKTKGIPHPAPTEAVYSEVKPGTSLGL